MAFDSIKGWIKGLNGKKGDSFPPEDSFGERPGRPDGSFGEGHPMPDDRYGRTGGNGERPERPPEMSSRFDEEGSDDRTKRKSLKKRFEEIGSKDDERS